jgi:hypothetical protein
MFPKHIPSLYVQNEGEDISTKAALSLTQARDRTVVRFTGGCGHMAAEHVHRMHELITEAFKDFGGGLLFGGTRMVERADPSKVRHGITEVPPLIRELCPDARVLGIVARSSDFGVAEYGLVVSSEPGNDFITIVHPHQDVCIALQKSADEAAADGTTRTVWDVEYESCAQIVGYLREYSRWSSLLFVWNGGGITEKEILLWAKNGWPVLLVRGTGRMADRYAEDKEFLAAHPQVRVADANAWSIREKLEELAAVPLTTRRQRMKLVPKVG